MHLECQSVLLCESQHSVRSTCIKLSKYRNDEESSKKERNLKISSK